VTDDGRVDDYSLIDVGDGARLERFGGHVVDRPHAGALAPRRRPADWSKADLRFDRDRGWSGSGLAAARAEWTVRLWDVAMSLRPTAAGQLGLFPEHAETFGWLVGQVTERQEAASSAVEVLNLFAYTGLATLAMARWGASVTHVDAARPSVAWARENAVANALDDRPIRWIVDDAAAYAAREARRGRRYDGIVLDPPTYGHGAGTTIWQLERDLPALLATCAELVRPDGFVLLTAHTEDHPADRLRRLLGTALGPRRPGTRDAGDLRLSAASGASLRLGAYARSDGRA
jgi:23S rRNA (cytosine1962-C5)-methyltransferase